MAEHRIRHFKCIICGEDIAQEYVVSCPQRKYCSKKCKWTFENRNKSKHTKKTEKDNKATNSKEYMSEYSKKYYKLNRRAENDRAKRYQRKNKDRLNAITKERRHNDIEKQNKNREKARKWYEKNKDKFNIRKKIYEKENSDKVFACKEVNKAISRGDICRSPCEICGSPKTDAHHDDYNKPLEVRWLCRSCHKEWHLHHEPARRVL